MNRFIVDYDNPDAGIGHSMGFINRNIKIAMRHGLQFAYTPEQLRKSSASDWRWRVRQGLRKLRGARTHETHNLGDDLNRMLALARELPSRAALESRIRAKELRLLTLPPFEMHIPSNAQVDDLVYQPVDDFIAAHPEPNTVFQLSNNRFGDYEYAGTRAWFQRVYQKARVAHPIALAFDPEYFTIAVHIRRGDLLPGRQFADLGSRMLPDRWYLTLLELVLKEIHRPVSIHVFSEGVGGEYRSETGAPFSWCNYFASTAHRVTEHIDTPFLETFHHLLHADLLIGSKSGMTHLAGMLGDSIKLVPPLWHSYRGASALMEVSEMLDEQSQEGVLAFLATHQEGRDHGSL